MFFPMGMLILFNNVTLIDRFKYDMTKKKQKFVNEAWYFNDALNLPQGPFDTRLR